MKEELKKKAIALRHRGYSIKEVAKKINVAQSTTSLWLRKIVLNDTARKRLAAHSRRGSLKGVATNKRLRVEIANSIKSGVVKDFDKLVISKEFKKAACALLYWCEGSKNKSHVNFMNSDPAMMATFINLLRLSFDIDESKFRILLHLHEYHDDLKQKKFWSRVTGVNIKQFSKTYLKPHTGKNKREGYPGCAALKYYDYRVSLELEFISRIIGKKFRRVA